MEPPIGFVKDCEKHLMCCLNKSIYGPKQAMLELSIRFTSTNQGFHSVKF